MEYCYFGVVSAMMYDRDFELFHEMLKLNKLRAYHFMISSLISACTGSSAGVLSREIHAHALKVGFENNLSVNNSLIGFYTKCGIAKDVQALFERMLVKDVISWMSMITASMEFGMVDLALKLFRKMPRETL